MPSDLETLTAVFADFPFDSDTLRGLSKRLEDILGKSQNGPPHGAADGTIDSATWTSARNVANALRRFLLAVEAMEHKDDNNSRSKSRDKR